MGGNALKAKFGVDTTRLGLEEFNRVAQDVTEFLFDTLPSPFVKVIPAYGAKSDFGDLDILIGSDSLDTFGDRKKLGDLIKSHYGAQCYLINGNVMSFDYRKGLEPGQVFQVDLIFEPRDSCDFALNYFSYNDLGNLVGRIAHAMGFKFGHNGLWYPVRNGTYQFAKLLVTNDYDRALAFLGYDPDRFRRGFYHLEDIYDYVFHGKYFRSSIFLLENRSNKARIRDRKRPTYMGFLAWVKQQLQDDDYKANFENKNQWLKKAFEDFPDFKVDLYDTMEKFHASCKARSIFNGNSVMSVTGIVGPDLGHLMKTYRAQFESVEAFHSHLFDTPSDALEAEWISLKNALFPCLP